MARSLRGVAIRLYTLTQTRNKDEKYVPLPDYMFQCMYVYMHVCMLVGWLVGVFI